MNGRATEPPPPGAGLSVWWKLAILAVPAVLLAAAVWRFGHTERPFLDGNAADFWYAACGVQVDAARRSHCTGPVFPARDGWFVYRGRDERYIAYHGSPLYRVSEADALAHFPSVVPQLEARMHLDGPNELRAAIIDAGYRKWLVADPGRKDAHALLACLRDAWLDRWQELDRLRNMSPPATFAAQAVTAWAQPMAQPWAAMLAIVEAEDRTRVLRPSFPYSAYRGHLDDEQNVARWWALAGYWHWNVIGELCFFWALLLFAAWPWLRGLRPWQWALHAGLLPVLFLLPHWLGYAHWSYLSSGPSGGVLYPSLIASFPRGDEKTWDAWAQERVPLLLYRWSYPAGPTPVWFHADLKGWGGFPRTGPGPVAALAFGIGLGVFVYGMRWIVFLKPRLLLDQLEKAREDWRSGPPLAPRAAADEDFPRSAG